MSTQKASVLRNYTSLEICSGGGGQALGLEQAGFIHDGLVEIESIACETLRKNRPEWNVIESDLRFFKGGKFRGVDLLAGGVPCPPFSIAGKQLGADDERDLFPEAIRLTDECRPKAIMLENVKGLMNGAFDSYRGAVDAQMKKLGYTCGWKLLNASDFGVSQLRPRVVFVGIKKDISENFSWPESLKIKPPSVGDLLCDLMGEKGWKGVSVWRKTASDIAPTLVGGSKKHGGPDLGPTRARAAWAALGVDGRGLADTCPDETFSGMPRLTVRMTARIQGFPDSWSFAGKKTAAYRQIGNAFPPPVACAVAQCISKALSARKSKAA